MSSAAQPAYRPRTRAGRRARPASQPLERDERLQLLQLERAITAQLADLECRESCEQLSRYLDSISCGDRVLVMAEVAR